MSLESQSFQDQLNDVTVTGTSVREVMHFQQRKSSREISSPIVQFKATICRHR